MPKRNRHRRTMKGGFLDTLSNWGSSLSQSASNLWQKAKSATSSTMSSSSSYTPSSYSSDSSSYTPPSQPVSPSVQQQQMVTSTYGGRTRRRHRHRKMRGGFEDNTPTTGIATTAAPFSGPTAQPHTWVGGKTRRHKKGKHSRSRRHRKH